MHVKELFKKLRIAAYVTAVLTIALGAVLIAWPMEVTGLICRIPHHKQAPFQAGAQLP